MARHIPRAKGTKLGEAGKIRLRRMKKKKKKKGTKIIVKKQPTFDEDRDRGFAVKDGGKKPKRDDLKFKLSAAAKKAIKKFKKKK